MARSTADLGKSPFLPPALSAFLRHRLLEATGLILLLVTLNTIGQALAQTMEFSCPASGTRTVLDFGQQRTQTRTWLGQEGMFCNYATRGGDRAKYAMLHSSNEESRKRPETAKYIDPIKAEAIWPLAVGKRHKASWNYASEIYYLEYTVAAFETIDTPMGPEQVFRVELVETSNVSYRANAKWWISPRHKVVLKREFTSNSPRFENIRYTVQRIVPPTQPRSTNP